jgi:lipoprotein NlpI
VHGRGLAADFARGRLALRRGDLNGALGDFNRCIEIDPKSPGGYLGRGMQRERKGDFAAAKAEFEHALELAPHDGAAYDSRGIVKQIMGDPEGAMKDFATSIKLDPTNTLAYRRRGEIYFASHRWTEALAEFRKSAEVAPIDQDFGRLFVWVVRTHLGETESANRELTEYFAKRPKHAAKDWTSRIISFVVGDVSEQDFWPPKDQTEPLSDVAAAWYAVDASQNRSHGSLPRRLNTGRVCEAWFYAGMKRLVAGDKTAANECFQRCVGTEEKTFVEYDLAKAELEMSGQQH